MSARIQDWIHYLEEGKGAATIRLVASCLAFIALATFYDLGSFKNFNSEEAMDAAQLARNISERKGFTTDYIRLSSVTLIQARANKKLGALQEMSPDNKLSIPATLAAGNEQNELRKLALLRTAHPDLANAPAYPVLLAAMMKVAPINYEISGKKPFVNYTPELWIAALNQVLFFLSALVLFVVARQLFDRPIAMAAAALFVGTELFWRFSVSGLSTTMLVLIFLCLAWCLARYERDARGSVYKLIFWGLLAGFLVGAGCLTRYAFGFLLGPVLLFFLLFGRAHRVKTCGAALAIFFLMLAPWLARNYSLSGNLFGTASHAICENTPAFQEDRLDRTLNSSFFGKVRVTDYVRKLVLNSQEILRSEIPHVGENWLSWFFFVGLLFPTQTRARSRLRVFIILSLLVLIVAQALSQSHRAYDSPRINHENLLVLVAPLMFVFGVALYFNLARKIVFAEPIFFYGATLLFCAMVSLPLIFSLLPPKISPGAYPPYFPPFIQQAASWMRPTELMMSDVPWAVAWYGDRQCVSLTQTYSKDFFVLHDEIRPVQAIYLTPKTTDSRLISGVVKEPLSWGRFVLEILSRNQVPTGFPLKIAPPGFLPDQVFLTDWERWKSAPKKSE